jgi:putative redox protein
MITTTWQAGATPVLSSNGSVTRAADLTLQIYVRRKNIPLTGVVVEVERTETRESYFLQRNIRLHGELDQAQIADLLRVANICPIHKVLSGKIAIETAVLS